MQWHLKERNSVLFCVVAVDEAATASRFRLAISSKTGLCVYFDRNKLRGGSANKGVPSKGWESFYYAMGERGLSKGDKRTQVIFFVNTQFVVSFIYLLYKKY
jgi:hypothetical protein